MADAEAMTLSRDFKAAPGSPPLPFPEPWGKEAERREAATAAASAEATTEISGT